MPCLSDIVGKYVNLYQSGSGMTGLCPFHSDNRVGSFVVNDHKNLWKCFSCGASHKGKADPKVTFIMQYLSLSKEEAISVLAEQFNENPEKLNVPDISSQNDSILEFDNILLDKAYSTIFKYADLKKEDKMYLQSRNVQDFSNYISFPLSFHTEKAILHQLNSFLSDDFMVPGFFYNEYTQKWGISYFNGIGIGIYNAHGLLVGIQIKTDKYIWFASAKEAVEISYSNACSNIAPVEVIYPAQLRRKYTIVITEGHFKARKLTEQGYIAVSIAGVSHWWKIKSVLEDISNMYSVEKVYIAFDADYVFNKGVAKYLALVYVNEKVQHRAPGKCSRSHRKLQRRAPKVQHAIPPGGMGKSYLLIF